MKKKTIRYFMLPLLFLAGMTGCVDNDVLMDTGKLPNETAMGSVSSALRSNLSFSGIAKVELVKDAEESVLADEISYILSQPASSEVKVTIGIGTEMSTEFQQEVEKQNYEIKAYNQTVHGRAYPKPLLIPATLPATNVQLEGGNTLTIPAGKSVSPVNRMMLSAQDLLSNYVYELILTVEQTNATMPPTRQSLSYIVNVYHRAADLMDPVDPNIQVSLDPEFLTVFYINTEIYQPLLADIFMYQKINNMTFVSEGSYSIGHIVNLRTATVNYDVAAKRALLTMGKDQRYVLEHTDRYIRPLQDHGRQVCLCIENGGQGIGFCTMDDSQIADFTRQVKDAVNFYQLDGVNLRDDDNGYGKEGMPPMNTTSYPKLIKALRDALPGKLLTIEDKGTPTEYFHDTHLCGGIAVGQYIDYAWHGYASQEEEIQIIEPWESDHPYSQYTRKPIAGLTPERYGSVNVPCYPPSELGWRAMDATMMWKTANRKKNNIIVFSNDLIANEQNQYEGATEGMLSFIDYVADEGSFWGPYPWDPDSFGSQSGSYWFWARVAGGHVNAYHSAYRYLAKNW